jgi:hypothetical protein
VIAALYLAGNREDTTEFGVFWVLNTHTTDFARNARTKARKNAS